MNVHYFTEYGIWYYKEPFELHHDITWWLMFRDIVITVRVVNKAMLLEVLEKRILYNCSINSFGIYNIK